MTTKQQRRMEAAARARAALGLDDEEPTAQRATNSAPVAAKEAADRPVEDAVGEETSERPSFQATPIDPKHYPKKHQIGDLQRGVSVWYRGERFYVEHCPVEWAKGCYVRIVDQPVRPHPHPAPTTLAIQRNGLNVRGTQKEMVGHTLSFCVHPDTLSLAPVTRNAYGVQPTLAGVARAERAKAGIKDVGDDVAVMLREAKTLDGVYQVGAEYLGVPEQELRAKYAHLNPGQQRMNIGNRMRAKWKKDQR